MDNRRRGPSRASGSRSNRLDYSTPTRWRKPARVGFSASLLAELHGVQVGVPDGKAQPDRLARKPRDVGRAAPLDRARQVVAPYLVTVGKCVTLDDVAAGILDLHPHVPCGGGREVEHEGIAVEDDRPGQELPAGEGRGYGHEAVYPDGVPAEPLGVLGEVGSLAGVHRDLVGRRLDGRRGLDDAPVLIVVAVEPVLLQAKPRPQERLRPDVEVLPIPAGHEHAVRNGRALSRRPASPDPPVFELGQVVGRPVQPLST